jgi:hypothetical protein
VLSQGISALWESDCWPIPVLEVIFRSFFHNEAETVDRRDAQSNVSWEAMDFQSIMTGARLSHID